MNETFEEFQQRLHCAQCSTDELIRYLFEIRNKCDEARQVAEDLRAWARHWLFPTKEDMNKTIKRPRAIDKLPWRG